MRSRLTSRRQGIGLTLRITAGVILLSILMLLLILLAGPVTGKYDVLFVISGSMEPAIETGDAILVTAVDPASIKVGDVITYTAPIRGNPTVTHRVTQIAPYGRQYPIVRTKGDANAEEDFWDVHLTNQAVWKQQATIPFGGWMMSHASRPGMSSALIIVPLLCLIVISIQVVRHNRHAQRELEEALISEEVGQVRQERPAAHPR